MATTIRLKKPTWMSTGYTGRGNPGKSITLPAGTEVAYQRQILNDGTVCHIVSYCENGDVYSITERVVREA